MDARQRLCPSQGCWPGALSTLGALPRGHCGSAHTPCLLHAAHWLSRCGRGCPPDAALVFHVVSRTSTGRAVPSSWYPLTQFCARSVFVDVDMCRVPHAYSVEAHSTPDLATPHPLFRDPVPRPCPARSLSLLPVPTRHSECVSYFPRSGSGIHHVSQELVPFVGVGRGHRAPVAGRPLATRVSERGALPSGRAAPPRFSPVSASTCPKHRVTQYPQVSTPESVPHHTDAPLSSEENPAHPFHATPASWHNPRTRGSAQERDRMRRGAAPPEARLLEWCLAFVCGSLGLHPLSQNRCSRAIRGSCPCSVFFKAFQLG
ncbi:uncharacterized protein LOC125089085 [Lutra lutra]|uniref:uncharacterized protein LOC125089085 n=1 Tax=Lutra lutra TaxID=9657 RepID=UPI001FD24F40|nr:uncharacterized protein LOC125089085 [Lutra lutra]